MIFEMKHLVNLYISNSKLATLSTDIKKLVNLEILDLANNKLTTLPSTIWELPKLKRLYAENNELEDLPLEFGRMYNIEVFGMINSMYCKRCSIFLIPLRFNWKSFES